MYEPMCAGTDPAPCLHPLPELQQVAERIPMRTTRTLSTQFLQLGRFGAQHITQVAQRFFNCMVCMHAHNDRMWHTMCAPAANMQLAPQQVNPLSLPIWFADVAKYPAKSGRRAGEGGHAEGMARGVCR